MEAPRELRKKSNLFPYEKIPQKFKHLNLENKIFFSSDLVSFTNTPFRK